VWGFVVGRAKKVDYRNLIDEALGCVRGHCTPGGPVDGLGRRSRALRVGGCRCRREAEDRPAMEPSKNPSLLAVDADKAVSTSPRGSGSVIKLTA
jgi:hypothetical protein